MRLEIPLLRILSLTVASATILLAPPGVVAQSQVREFLVQIEESGQNDTAWIGVWLQDIIDGGIQIVALVPGGPAELASLRVGDIILKGNSRPLPKQAALDRLLRDLTPGDPLELRVVRGDNTIDTRLTVASRSARYARWLSAAPQVVASDSAPRPPRPPSATRAPSPLLFSLRRGHVIGVQVTDVTPALRTHYGAPEGYGVLVTRSFSGGIASRSGIVVGDLIVRVDGIGIASSREFEGALLRWNPNTALRTELVRDGKSTIVELVATLESRAEEAQDRAAERAAERELMSRRMRLELQRLERRMNELKRELEKVEGDD